MVLNKYLFIKWVKWINWEVTLFLELLNFFFFFFESTNGCNKIDMQDLCSFSHVGAWLHYITSDKVCNPDKDADALRPCGEAPDLDVEGRGWWNLHRKTLKERNRWTKSWKMLRFSQVRGRWWKVFRVVVIAVIQFTRWFYARHCARHLGCNVEQGGKTFMEFNV